MNIQIFPRREAYASAHWGLPIGMDLRRFTRLTNGFSKKAENYMYAVSPHFMNYNFARIHKTSRVTPATKAGIADRVLAIRELCELAPWKPVVTKRGPYEPRQPKQAYSAGRNSARQSSPVHIHVDKQFKTVRKASFHDSMGTGTCAF